VISISCHSEHIQNKSFFRFIYDFCQMMASK
jgi:hypothetical protein